MVRLAAVGDRHGEWPGVELRLRAAASGPDAAVVLDGDPAAVARLLAEGKRVLADADLPPAPRLAAWNRDRFLPSRQLIRQQLASLGAPGLIRLHRLGLGDLRRDLDVVLWLAGRAPDVAFALQGDAGLHVHLGFPGGAMALLTHSASPPSAADACSLSVIAAHGAAYADDREARQLLFTRDAARAVRADDRHLALAAMAQAFLDAGADLSPHWAGVRAVEDAVGVSLMTGESVPVGGH
ncbi:MAG: hypothetical protein ACRC33_13770 [Gemmataceae bacterium]